LFQFGHRHIQVLSNESHFGPAYPNIAPCRAGAAPAALQALEMQSRGIPRIFFIAVHIIYFTGRQTAGELQIENVEFRNALIWRNYLRHSALRTIRGGIRFGWNFRRLVLAKLRLLGYQRIIKSWGLSVNLAVFVVSNILKSLLPTSKIAVP